MVRARCIPHTMERATGMSQEIAEMILPAAGMSMANVTQNMKGCGVRVDGNKKP